MDILIGNKKKFAIELGNYKKEKQAGKIRFWINDQSFGAFKKSAGLTNVINSLKNIVEGNIDLYDDSFDNKTNEEIFRLCLVLIGKDLESLTDEDYELMERYERFGFDLGSQFYDVARVIYVKDGQCNFLWSTHTDRSTANIDYLKGLKHGSVSLDTLSTVLEEFLEALNI